MTSFFAKNNDAVVNYGQLRALVVDDYPGMRSALKITLSNFGLSRIDMAANVGEVLFKAQNTRYDLILCDFNLGEGRDGQQLLEELRHRQLISLGAVFVMVTAESGYEKVVATAELAPDDYLIKPFSSELMRARLDAILLRKQAFAEVYGHFENHEIDEAIAGCDDIVRNKPKYVVDALRFKGELLNAIGRFEEAEELYRKVIEMRAVPWARLGLARSLHEMKKEGEAEEILHDILDTAPEVVAAYDLLAEVCTANKDMQGAQQALERGVAVSAKTVRRQQRLGEVAFANGDLEVAKQAYSDALEKGRHSIFVGAADFGHLCRVQVEQGDLNGALDTLKKGKMTLQADPEGQLVGAVVRGLVHTRAGNPAEAERAMDEAARLSQGGARTDGRLMLDYADTCMANGRFEQADAVIREVARNAHDSESLLSKARQIYEKAGRSDVGDALLKECTASVRSLNNEAVILAKKGDYQGALAKLRQATREAPFNPRILMNTVWVMLKHLEAEGLDHDLHDEAKALLEEADRQSPGHPRIATLRGQMKDVEARYGIRRRDA
ncbi:MAG: tetratricopeptide repeat protein [Pseudomonadota bacterium]